MVVDAKQLDGKPRKIGLLKGQPVMEARTKGGFHMVTDAAGKPIGAGPHRAIARIIAKNRNPDVQYFDLAKGGWVDPALVSWLLPKWEGVTDRLATIYDSMHQG